MGVRIPVSLLVFDLTSKCLSESLLLYHSRSLYSASLPSACLNPRSDTCLAPRIRLCGNFRLLSQPVKQRIEWRLRYQSRYSYFSSPQLMILIRAPIPVSFPRFVSACRVLFVLIGHLECRLRYQSRSGN